MLPQTVFLTWLVLFLLQLGFESTLTLLNLRHAKTHREPPAELAGLVDAATVVRTTGYTLARNRLALVSHSVRGALTVAVVAFGLLGLLDDALGTWLGNRYLHGISAVVALGMLSSLVSLPFAIYGQFVVEQRFGFNRMTWATFVGDLLKGLAVSLALGVPLLLAVFWLVANAGNWWWLYAFVFVAGFQLLVSYLYPTWIAPLFNRFAPLPDGELRARLLGLAERLQFAVRDIQVMDGSRRSRHSNAYFTGIGRSRRIVLYDTLIELLDPGQTAAVLAHEIGHARRRHIVKRLALSLLLLLAGLWLIGWLIEQPALFTAFGFTAASTHAALVVLALASGPALFVLNPVLTGWSRRHEYQADRFAVQATGNAEDLGGALTTLGADNLSNFHPHPWYSAYHYSHPTLVERLRAMRVYWA